MTENIKDILKEAGRGFVEFNDTEIEKLVPDAEYKLILKKEFEALFESNIKNFKGEKEFIFEFTYYLENGVYKMDDNITIYMFKEACEKAFMEYIEKRYEEKQLDTPTWEVNITDKKFWNMI